MKSINDSKSKPSSLNKANALGQQKAPLLRRSAFAAGDLQRYVVKPPCTNDQGGDGK